MSENNTQRKDFDRIDRMNQFYRQGLIETTKVKLKIPPHFNPLPLVRGERLVRGRMKPQMNTEEYKS